LAADALRHPHSTALALCYVGGLIFGFCEASEHLARQARQLIALSEQHKLDGYRPHAMAFLGWALCQSGELERGIEYIERAVKAFDSVEYRLGVAGHLANLADAQRKVGRLVAAKASSTRAIEMTFASANGWLAPEVLRVDALIDYEAAVGNADAAIERLGMAVQRARQLGSPVFERRCLSSLIEIGDAAPNVETEKRLREMSHLANLKDLVESTVGRIGTLCQN
jgi:tetratricopeptide (TPR) repeat protein